jgi:hypothetical protein
MEKEELEIIHKESEGYFTGGYITVKEFSVKFAAKGKKLVRMLEILELINSGVFISAKEFADNVRINERIIERDLIFLKKIGFIKYDGSKTTGKYITTDVLIEFLKSILKFDN